VPDGAVKSKLAAIAAYGATLHHCAPTMAARDALAERVREQTGATLVHPFTDPRVIAGQGTATLELLRESGPFDVLLAPIGAGGMGEVWKAHDPVLDRTVAVKVIRPHLADDFTTRERLRTEAKLAGSLRHPGIVDVFDYGEHLGVDGRTTPYLVMLLVDGVTLAEVLSSRVALTLGETMSIVSEMANALKTAHESGIVHRDLKPGNVMLTGSAA
jgi:threonine dehydratase